MSALDNIPCAHTPLHQRAAAILAAHGDMLQDQRRSDDLVFLNMLVRRHIVFGTARYEARLEEIEVFLNFDYRRFEKEQKRLKEVEADLYKVGDLVRYCTLYFRSFSEYKESLMLIFKVEVDYAGPDFHRYTGEMCAGGKIQAYQHQLIKPTEEDHLTWEEYRDVRAMITTNRRAA